MKLLAYNTVQETHGGPFDSFREAFKWAEENLPGGIPAHKLEMIDEYEEELLEDGRTMVGTVCCGDRCCEEDVVIFDAERHEPDEDGYIEW